MSRDGHDGNAKRQCCAQAKRQHVEVLRETGARFVRSAKIIGEIGAARATKEKPLSAGPVMGVGKEGYRLLAGHPTRKTAPEPESLQKAKQLRIFSSAGTRRSDYSGRYRAARLRRSGARRFLAPVSRVDLRGVVFGQAYPLVKNPYRSFRQTVSNRDWKLSARSGRQPCKQLARKLLLPVGKYLRFKEPAKATLLSYALQIWLVPPPPLNTY